MLPDKSRAGFFLGDGAQMEQGHLEWMLFSGLGTVVCICSMIKKGSSSSQAASMAVVFPWEMVMHVMQESLKGESRSNIMHWMCMHLMQMTRLTIVVSVAALQVLVLARAGRLQPPSSITSAGARPRCALLQLAN
jgi:hypothetical protein